MKKHATFAPSNLKAAFECAGAIKTRLQLMEQPIIREDEYVGSIKSRDTHIVINKQESQHDQAR